MGVKQSLDIFLERVRQRNTRKYKNKMDEMLSPKTGFVVVSGNDGKEFAKIK